MIKFWHSDNECNFALPFCFRRSSASFFLLSLAAILPPSIFFLSSFVSPAPSTLESSLESFGLPLPSTLTFWFFDSIKSFFRAFFSLRSAAFAFIRSSFRFLRRSSSCFRRASRAAFFLSFFARINSIYHGLEKVTTNITWFTRIILEGWNCNTIDKH